MKTPDIGLKSNTKTTMVGLCNARLADAIDLSLDIKQAHWNLKGPTFIAVHELLDMLRAHLDTNADTVAERVAQLDGVAMGTVQAVGEASALSPYPTDIHKVADHVGALVERFAALSKSVREAIDTRPGGRRRRHRRHLHRLLARPRQGPLVPQKPPRMRP